MNRTDRDGCLDYTDDRWCDETAVYVTDAVMRVIRAPQSGELQRSRQRGACSRLRIGVKVGHGCGSKETGRAGRGLSDTKNRLRKIEKLSYPLLLEYQIQHVITPSFFALIGV